MADASSGWTEERVELLGKLWGEGRSASQIAGVLGGGVTRNAVIGKVHRLGLAARAKAGGPAPVRAAKPVRAAPAAVRLRPAEAGAMPPAILQPAPVPEAMIPVSERVSILELRENMCRWPIGDPTSPDFGFCGQRSATGLPYCTHHCRIAYQPAADRRRLRA